MSRFRVAGMALLCLVLAGCGDSAGPAEFDVTQAQADFDAFGDDAGSATNDILFDGFDEIGELLQAGDMPARIGATDSRPFGGTQVSLSHAAMGPVLSVRLMPDSLKGKTFEFDVAADSYEETARTGAPSDGTRFILYAVDGDGEFAAPLDEVGYVDVTDQNDGARRQVRVVAVVNGSTAADYIGWATGDADSGTYGFEGFVLLGSEQVDFELAGWSDPSGTGRRDSLESRLEMRDGEFVIDGSLMFEDDGSNTTSGFTVDYRSRGGAFYMEQRDDGTLSTSSVELNGEAYATSSEPSGEAPVFVGVDPHMVSPEQAAFFEGANNLMLLPYQVAVFAYGPVWRLIAPILLPG